jgi:hypothetical protein
MTIGKVVKITICDEEVRIGKLMDEIVEMREQTDNDRVQMVIIYLVPENGVG